MSKNKILISVLCVASVISENTKERNVTTTSSTISAINITVDDIKTLKIELNNFLTTCALTNITRDKKEISTPRLLTTNKQNLVKENATISPEIIITNFTEAVKKLKTKSYKLSTTPLTIIKTKSDKLFTTRLSIIKTKSDKLPTTPLHVMKTAPLNLTKTKSDKLPTAPLNLTKTKSDNLRTTYLTTSIKTESDKLPIMPLNIKKTKSDKSSITPLNLKDDKEISIPRLLATNTQNSTKVKASKSPELMAKVKNFRSKKEEKYSVAIKEDILSGSETDFAPMNLKPIYIKNNANNVRAACPKFKYAKTRFVLNDMADEWQTIYYDLPEKIRCFRIQITKVTSAEKVQYMNKYGNFSGKVNWNECNLEIKSHSIHDRRHFLQVNNADFGVLNNIILLDPPDSKGDRNKRDKRKYSLKNESPDQWLVFNNLLVMRDCHEGGIVVFSKIEEYPKQVEIRDVLKLFGEQEMTGKNVCHSDNLVRVVRFDTSSLEDDYSFD